MSFFTGHPAIRQLAKEAVAAMNELGMLTQPAVEFLEANEGDVCESLDDHAKDVNDTIKTSLVDAIREELLTTIDYARLHKERNE